MGRGEASQRQGEKVQPPQAFRAARPTSHSRGGHRRSSAACPARRETQVGKRRDSAPGAGAARSGAAAGTCPAWPAGRAVSEEVGGPGGEPASGSVHRGHRSAPHLRRGWEVTGGRETPGATAASGGRSDAAGAPRRRRPPPRILPPWDAFAAPPRRRARETERAPPGGAVRASTCPVALAPRVGRSPFHFGGSAPARSRADGWGARARPRAGTADRGRLLVTDVGKILRGSKTGKGVAPASGVSASAGDPADTWRLARRDPKYGSRASPREEKQTGLASASALVRNRRVPRGHGVKGAPTLGRVRSGPCPRAVGGAPQSSPVPKTQGWSFLRFSPK